MNDYYNLLLINTDTFNSHLKCALNFPPHKEATSLLTSEPEMAQAAPVTQIAVDNLSYKGQYCVTVPVNIN